MELALKNILIPADASESCKAAIDSAAYLGKLFGSQLHIVNVMEKNQTLSGSTIPEEINFLVGNKIGEMISESKNKTGADIHLIRKEGQIYKEIVKAADEIHADIIIMGTHGVSGFKEFWIGSNAYRVVSAANCPVLTVQENFQQREFKTIVLPIDTSLDTRQKVPYAAQLAKRTGATIHIIGVSSDNDTFTKSHLKSYVNQVKHYIDDRQIPNVTEFRTGKNIADQTLDYAKEINADLIVIMTEQEEDAANIFLGPYAQQMVNHSPIPVMSIKPKELLKSSVSL